MYAESDEQDSLARLGFLAMHVSLISTALYVKSWEDESPVVVKNNLTFPDPWYSYTVFSSISSLFRETGGLQPVD